MTDWPLIIVRFALYADLMFLFGLAFFGLYVLKEERGHPIYNAPACRALAVLAAIGIGLSCIGLALAAAAMSGVPIGKLDRAILTMLATETSFGVAWQARMAALAVALGVATWFCLRAAGSLAVVAAASAAAIGTLAWSGHAAATEGGIGVLHLIADIVHLLAAGAWFGALGALVWLLFAASPEDSDRLRMTHRALEGFSSVGAVAVGAIIATGAVNSIILIGVANLTSLPASLYGQLLLAKIALFLAMLGFAAANRFRLTPSLDRAIISGEPRVALAALRWSLAAECAAALLVLALVAWLGTLMPPASAG